MTELETLRGHLDRAQNELAALKAKLDEERKRQQRVPARVDIGKRCPVVGCNEVLTVLAASEKIEDEHYPDTVPGVGYSTFYGWRRIDARSKSRCDAGHIVSVEFLR